MSNPGGSQVSRKPKMLVACFDGTAGLYNAAVRLQKSYTIANTETNGTPLEHECRQVRLIVKERYG